MDAIARQKRISSLGGILGPFFVLGALAAAALDGAVLDILEDLPKDLVAEALIATLILFIRSTYQ